MTPTLDEYSHISAYEDASNILGSNSSKIIANNTKLIRGQSGKIYVRLHSTDVVVYDQNGRISLYTGGYHTQTTLDRINRYTPHGIDVRKVDGELYLIWPDGTEEKFKEGVQVPEP